MEVEIVEPLFGEGEATSEIPMEDGGVEIVFGAEIETGIPPAGALHGDNLVTALKESELSSIALDLIAEYESDRRSRVDWEEAIKNGIQLLGLKIEEVREPFPGACGAHHPLMLESTVQFQARAISELFPSNGPVKVATIGKASQKLSEQAHRVAEFMNWQLTERMDDYYDDLDQMLFWLPLAGSMFRKVWWDQVLNQPCSRYIPAEDFVVSDRAVDLKSVRRMTHVIRVDHNELLKMQKSGFYADIAIEKPALPENGSIKEVIHEVEGTTPPKQAESSAGDPGQHTLLEMHVDLDIPGFEDADDEGPTGIALPYVVTVDKDSQKVLAIRRNWREGDPLKERLTHFVHYKFLPGLGFYGFSLVHLMGNLQKSATAVLRMLQDAGMFASFPGGFKAKGIHMPSNSPIKFGEFRDIESYGDDLRKAIVPIPTKEPSQVLAALLGSLVDSGRRLAAIADMNVADMNKEAPVGTTLAIMEQGIKVMSAIHKRLHKAQRDELRLLARVNHDYMPAEYPYEVRGGPRTVFKDDFNANVDVFPVSDPNIFSETQRVMRAQTMLQLAQQFPQHHDLREALYQMHVAIGTPDPDTLLVPEMGAKPADPVTENVMVLNQRPIKAYDYQDHEAHIHVHMGFMQDPGSGGNPEAQKYVAPPMVAHIAEHVAFLYRQKYAAAVQMPPAPQFGLTAKDDQVMRLPPEVENEIARQQAMVTGQLGPTRGLPDLSGGQGKPTPEEMIGQAQLANAQTNQQKAAAQIEKDRRLVELKERDQALKEADTVHDNQLARDRLAQEAALEVSRQRGDIATALTSKGAV